jgi:lipoprotein NlpI
MRRLLPASFALAAAALVVTLTGCDRIQQQRADQHFVSAQSKHQSGDLDGAIADYGKAIAIRPKAALYYQMRGQARFAKKQYAASVDDSNEALRLQPKDPDHLFLRAIARRELGEVDEAIADFDQAIAIKPSAPLYANRALTLVRKGDFPKALADSDMAISLHSAQSWPYAARADVKISMGDLDGALEDLKMAMSASRRPADETRRATALIHMLRGDWRSAQQDMESIAGEPGPSQAYIHLFLWICRAKQGQTAEAHDALANFRGGHSFSEDDHWAQTIISFLLGKLPEEDFLAAAASDDAKTDHDQRCEACYYAAVKRQLAGDETAAIDLYRQCVATKHYAFYEYRLAREELKRLGKLEQQ